MKKIFFITLLLFGFAFFVTGVSAEGMCICNDVKYEVDIPIIGKKEFTIKKIGTNASESSCEGQVTPFAFGTTTYSGCSFVKDACFCTVSTTLSYLNGGKAVASDVSEENCSEYHSVGTVPVLGDPVEYIDCNWLKAVSTTAGTIPSAPSTDPTLGAVPVVNPTALGALPSGGTTGGVAGAAKAGAEVAKNVSRIELGNPLKSTDVRIILGKIVSAGMGILGSVTLLVFVYGGFLWLTSAGSAEKVKKGSQTMMWAVVGLFLIFGSYAILGLVLEGINAKQQGSSGPVTGLNIK